MVRLSAVLVLIAGVASAHSIVDVGVSFDVPPFVPVQQPFRYRVIADDRANDNGSGVVVTVKLPSSVTISNVANSGTWNCSTSKQTITCSADFIVPGPNPIDINVLAPAQPASLRATANVQSLGSLDQNPSNDNASADIVVFDPSLCTAAPPLLLEPDDGSHSTPVVPLSWSPVAGAQSYTIFTAVEGAAAAPALTANTNSATLVAEPGTSEWWIVANFGNCPSLQSAHRHFTATSTLPRPVRTFADGFQSPFGLALAPSGDLYLSDQTNNVISKIANGTISKVVGTPGVAGSADGQFALFQSPRGLTVTPLDGFVFVADSSNHEVRILYVGGPFVPAYDAAGVPGVPGAVDDTSDKARFNAPSGIAATERGTLYVADTANNRIRKMTQVPGFVGYFNVTTVATNLHAPLAVAVDSNGVVSIADTDDGSIRRLDGSVIASGFDHPAGVAADARGNLFVTDRTSVYRIAPSGLVTVVASGLASPAGIAVDASNRIFVALSGSHTVDVIEMPALAMRRRAAR